MKKVLVIFVAIGTIAVLALSLPLLITKKSESAGVITPIGSTEKGQEISLSAEAYYLDGNEAEGVTESAYLEEEDAREIGEMFSGEYETLREAADLEWYRYALTPVYIGRTLESIDKYSTDFVPDDDGSGFIYGPAIYVLDESTVAVFSPKSGVYWIAEKKGEAFNLDVLKKHVEKAQSDAAAEIAKEAEEASQDEGDEEEILWDAGEKPDFTLDAE